MEERGGGDGGPDRGIRGPGGAGARGRGSPVWSPASRAGLPSVAPAHPACGLVGESQVAAGPRAYSSPSHPDSGLPPPRPRPQLLPVLANLEPSLRRPWRETRGRLELMEHPHLGTQSGLAAGSFGLGRGRGGGREPRVCLWGLGENLPQCLKQRIAAWLALESAFGVREPEPRRDPQDCCVDQDPNISEWLTWRWQIRVGIVIPTSLADNRNTCVNFPAGHNNSS